MKTNSVKEKKGLSIIVLVVFSLIILSVIITFSLMIMNAAGYARINKNNSKIYEQNAMQKIEEQTVIDFSACYVIEEDFAIIKIQDNSSDIVMFTCIKVYDGQIPNVAEAEWEYTNTFIAPDDGEYLIYAKDVQGNISDAVVVNVEI